jgi:hypothetical protein
MSSKMEAIAFATFLMVLPVLVSGQAMPVTLTPGSYAGYSCYPAMPGCPSPALSCVTPEQANNPLLLIPPVSSGCTRSLSVNGNVASWADDCGKTGTFTGSLAVTSNPSTYDIEQSVGFLGSASLSLSYVGSSSCNPSPASARTVAAFGAPMKTSVISLDADTGVATFRNEHGYTVAAKVAPDAVHPGTAVQLRRKRNSGAGPCVEMSVITCDAQECGIGFDLVTMSCPGQPNTTTCEPNPRCTIDLSARTKAQAEALDSTPERDACACHAEYDRARGICPYLPGMSGIECWTKAGQRLQECLEKAKKTMP